MNLLNKIRLFFWLKYIKFLNKTKRILGNSIHYIGGNDTLPPPLTAEEEAYLLKNLEKGDNSVRPVLIERNLRLVAYIARKFENTGIGFDDLFSIGSIGLIKSVNTFNPDKNIKLATYASRCIENEILMHLRRNNRSRSEVSIDEPLNIDWDGNELLLSDILGTENDVIHRGLEDEVDRQLLNKAMDKLSSTEEKIVRHRYGLDNNDKMTQEEVAIALGMSQSYISRLEKRILEKLKKELRKLV